MAYSYEQVMTALRNADAAGDTEGARRLAQIAQGLKKQPTQPQAPVQQEEPSMFEFLTGKARKGHTQDPIAGVLQKGAEGAFAGLESA